MSSSGGSATAGSFAAALTGARPGLVWIDYTAYAERLLGRPVPWLDVDALIAWQRTATGLIDSDVIGVDATALLDAWIGAHPDLAVAMSAKRRATAPLRTLFADAALRAHLADLVGSLRAAFSTRAIALLLGTPDALAAVAYRGAFGGAALEFDEDDIDAAAVYVADLLRAMAESGPDALVVEPPEPGTALTADRIELYGPIRNVAAHYRWHLGFVTESPPPELPAALQPSFWLAAAEVAGVPTGLVVPQGFWDTDAPPPGPARGFRRVRIPPGTRPEHVLERIGVLRAPER